jgi:hypothetical protein
MVRPLLFLLLPLAAFASGVDRTYPGSGTDFEGWRPLTRRYLAVLVGRTLGRYQTPLDYPSVEAPPDVEDRDLGDIVRALAAGVMSAPRGRFDPMGKVNRLNLALTLDRLGRSCRGWPDTLPRRRFHWPQDLHLAQDQREAMERIFRFRILRSDDLFFSDRKRFRPRRVATRYEAMVALDRVLTVLGTRPERYPVNYPDLPDAHYARLAIRDLYRRGILGYPLPGRGQTRSNPPPQRVRFAPTTPAPTLPLARAPYRPRTVLDLATSELPGARKLDALTHKIDVETVQRNLLDGAWDRLRVHAQASGLPRQKLLTKITAHRRKVGRIHLALGRLLEDLPTGRRGGPEILARTTLRPPLRKAQQKAKQLYRRFTNLRDQVRGVAAVPLPNYILPLLPLAARGTPLAGLLEGGALEGDRSDLSDALLLTPERLPEKSPPSSQTKVPTLPSTSQENAPSDATTEDALDDLDDLGLDEDEDEDDLGLDDLDDEDDMDLGDEDL